MGALRTLRGTITPGRVVWLAGLGTAMSLLGDASLYIVLPTQYAKAGIALGDVGLMLAANRAIRIFINTPYGEIIARIPRRRMLVPSLFLGALAVFLYAVPGFWPLLIGRLLWGAAWSGIALGCTTAILDVAEDHNRGRLVGRYQMWFFIGVGVSSLAGGVLFDAVGYQATFVVAGFVVLAAALLWLFLLPETRGYRDGDSEAEVIPRPSAPVPADPPPAKGPESVWLLAFAIGIHGLNWLVFIGMAVTLLPLLLQERIGEVVMLGLVAVQLVSFTGGLSAFNTLLSLVSSPVSGWLSDRSGDRWRLTALSLSLGAVSLGAAATGDGAMVVLATMGNAVVTGVLTTQVTALVGDYARPGSGREGRQGRVLGVMNTVGDIGGAVGPFAAFQLLPALGLAGVYGLSALLVAAALPAALWASARARHVQLRGATAG